MSHPHCPEYRVGGAPGGTPGLGHAISKAPIRRGFYKVDSDTESLARSPGRILLEYLQQLLETRQLLVI